MGGLFTVSCIWVRYCFNQSYVGFAGRVQYIMIGVFVLIPEYQLVLVS